MIACARSSDIFSSFLTLMFFIFYFFFLGLGLATEGRLSIVSAKSWVGEMLGKIGRVGVDCYICESRDQRDVADEFG